MKNVSKKANITSPLGSVLVVEDDPVLALDIEATLRAHGATNVTICASLACTIAALEHQKPDSIILDVHLSDRDDGWTLAELVEELGPNRPRIVFSTGAPDAIPAGIADLGTIMAKPYDPNHLVPLLARQKPRGIFSRLKASLTSSPA
ncbi:response regulator [Altererythrobacter indicus]|uniref:Response regulator n=1 Tax=Altericroceibacterium indicum TaxID=374177 RepID=A0A845A6W6_9SPHN|nr:response regulator [Altericroceibacterium indicum]MXP25960.1 response regulator [Altericroceibacterium indicum]